MVKTVECCSCLSIYWGCPGFLGRSIGVTPWPSCCPSMTNLTKTRRWFSAQQKAGPVGLCLSEGLSCTSVARRLPQADLLWGHNQRLRRPGPKLPAPLRQARIAAVTASRARGQQKSSESIYRGFRNAPPHTPFRSRSGCANLLRLQHETVELCSCP